MISKSRAQSTSDCRMISLQKREIAILLSIVHHSPHKSLRNAELRALRMMRMHLHLQEGHQQGPKPEISNLAWNPKIVHILATCTAAGCVNVFDLKKQASIMSLNDNQG